LDTTSGACLVLRECTALVLFALLLSSAPPELTVVLPLPLYLSWLSLPTSTSFPPNSIQNGVLDLFSLFEFLGKIVNPLHDYSEFKLKISDPLKNKRTKIAMTRLAVVLKAVMLRRTKTMMIDGKPLLALPEREIIEIKGPFLDE
jgi:hypothetical protein